MLRYNRARRAEWAEAQKRLEADSLATARLAYLKGLATEEQIALVEEANREAEETGVKLPPLLSPPEHRTHFEEHVKPAFQGDQTAEKQGKGILGMVSGIFGGQAAATSSETAESQLATATATVTGVTQHVQEKAKDAWEQERQNQRDGGSLDQLGLETGSSGQASGKKGWRPW